MINSLVELHDNFLIYTSNVYFVVMPLILLIILLLCIKILQRVVREIMTEYSKKEIRKHFVLSAFNSLRYLWKKSYKQVRHEIKKILKSIVKEVFIEEK